MEKESSPIRISRVQRKWRVSIGILLLQIHAELDAPDNILVSNDYERHFEFLISQLENSAAEARGLATLVLSALIRQLKGEHQINAGLRVMRLIQDTPLRSHTLKAEASEQVRSTYLTCLL